MVPPDSLKQRVENFVAWLFTDFQPHVPRGAKVINDSLLGNQYFSRHEVAVIDTPLFQRLKRIKQTGLVYHVFPSATHSRFEHSLGVATLAERCFNAVRDRFQVEERKPFPADHDRLSGDLAHLRMAALLHDVGHGLCSHAAEQMYSAFSDLREFKNRPRFTKNQPGEILSYLIITSPTFCNWFEQFVVKECGARIELDTVAEMVLGKHPDSDRYFLAQIVSSPFDADKLDYIARDSYYCGLALTVDLGRFYSMIATAKKGDHRVLALRTYVPLEQIYFSRMILFSSVYQHQKVKCLDAMLRATVQHIIENADQCAVQVRDRSITFAEPVQYLYVTDEEFFGTLGGFGDEYVKKMLTRFARRDLFVRCIELSRRTVTNWNTYNRKTLTDWSVNGLAVEGIEDEIHKRLPEGVRGACNRGDIRLSVPGPPTLKGDFAYIQTDPGGPLEPIEEYFPLEDWAEAYAHNKWRSFVYAPAQVASKVATAAASVLADYKIDVNRVRSDTRCHLNS